MTIRLMLADDHRMLREGLGRSMRELEFDVVGEAGDGAAADALLADRPVDLVLMDIKMPVLDGIAATARIAAEHPGVVVCLLSSHDRSALPDDLVTCGAAAFVPKEELSPRLLADLWARLTDGT